MMILRTFILVLFFSIHGCSFARDSQRPVVAKLGSVLIEIPTGFGEQHHTAPNKQTELDVYVSSNELVPTLIQLTRIVVPDAKADLGEKARFGAASHFLTGFLQTFSKNVADWSPLPAEPVQLGGYLAARARWTGNFHGIPTTGVMYIVVFGKESFCFHVFGRSDVPNLPLKSSIRAIEELRAGADTSLKRASGQ